MLFTIEYNAFGIIACRKTMRWKNDEMIMDKILFHIVLHLDDIYYFRKFCKSE